MHVGADIIDAEGGVVVVYKDTYENLKNYWPRGSYIILKNKYVVPENSPLINIGYK